MQTFPAYDSPILAYSQTADEGISWRCLTHGRRRKLGATELVIGEVQEEDLRTTSLYMQAHQESRAIEQELSYNDALSLRVM